MVIILEQSLATSLVPSVILTILVTGHPAMMILLSQGLYIYKEFNKKTYKKFIKINFQRVLKDNI